MRGWLNRYGDAVLGAAAGTLATVEVLLWEPAQLPEAALLGAVSGLALAFRRVQPVPAFLVSVAAMFGVIRFASGFDNDSIAVSVVFFVSLYSLGRWTPGVSAWVGAMCVLGEVVAFVVGDSLLRDDPASVSDVAFATLFVGSPWAAGVAIRLRREREESLVAEQEQVAVRERARISRELHDVVSHSIAVTVLQARGGRAMLGRDEAAVRGAFDAIETTNTAALSDMRRLLAVLRDTEPDDPASEAATAGPQPSLANLDRLVERVRGAGLSVELAVHGIPARCLRAWTCRRTGSSRRR